MTDRRDQRSVTRVEFVVEDSSYPFVAASEATNGKVELAEMVPRDAGVYAEFFNLTGLDPEQMHALASDHDTVDATLVAEYENGGLFEFLVAENCPAVTLAEAGALPRTIRAADGRGRIVAEVPQHYDVSRVIDDFLRTIDGADLVCKQERASVTPLFTDAAVEQFLDSHLTDRQCEVVRTAFEKGYYEWPRDCTGEEVAEDLGITSATFSEHIHAAERKLLATLFEDN